jgi:cell division protease FtsH
VRAFPRACFSWALPARERHLLARAVAGEAACRSFRYLRIGIRRDVRRRRRFARARSFFQPPKKFAAIIFVDEIDAVGRVRGTGVGGGNDEREQTLNQILVEMDGFEPNEKVIVMAATNRPDVLTPRFFAPADSIAASPSICRIGKIARR